MDWELIFWVVGGILALIALFGIVVVGPHLNIGEDLWEYPETNIDDMEDRRH